MNENLEGINACHLKDPKLSPFYLFFTVTVNNFSIRENSSTIRLDSRAYIYTSSLKLSSWSKFALEFAKRRRYAEVILEVEFGHRLQVE